MHFHLFEGDLLHMCSGKLTSRKQKVDQIFGPENCSYLDVNNFLNLSHIISQSVFIKGGPQFMYCKTEVILLLLSSVYPYILIKAAQVRPQDFIMSFFNFFLLSFDEVF